MGFLVRAPRRSRDWALALGLAVCAHLLTLLALGWRIPKGPPPALPDTLPPVDIQLLRPPAAAPPAPSAAPVSPTPQARPRPVRPSPAEAPTLSAPVAPAPLPPALAQAPADCAPEDLPLLTDAEKAACRNQIDADKERRLARGADERAGKQVAEGNRGTQTFRADADRQAYYDGLEMAQAKQNRAQDLQTAGPHTARTSIGVAGVNCSNVSFPLLGGVDLAPDLFEKAHKQEHKPTYGQAKCKAYLGASPGP